MQATITQASQHHLSAAGAALTSIKIISTRRALKKATSRSAVPTQAPSIDTSSDQDSAVASVSTAQVIKYGLVTAGSSQQVQEREKDDPQEVQHVPEAARKPDQRLTDLTVCHNHSAQVYSCRSQ